jgi:hypothetical protein
MAIKFISDDVIEDVLVYLDAITLWLDRALELWEKDALESLCGSIRITTRFNKRNSRMKNRGYKAKLTLRQPTDDALRFLKQRLDINARYLINYVEVALDIVMPTQRDAEELHQFIEKRWIKKGHRIMNGTKKIKEETTCLGSKKYKSQFLIYSSLPSRHFKDKPVCHIECRFQGSPKIKQRLCISTIDDLLSFDYSKFWSETLCLRELNVEKFGKFWYGIHLNSRSRIIVHGRYSRNVDESNGHLLCRVCRHKFFLMDSNIGQEFITNLKIFAKGFGKTLPLDRLLIPVDVDVVIKKARHPNLLARSGFL